MDPTAQPVIDKSRRSADILKAELERKSRDLYKVYNPTNQDFVVVFNAAISPELWTVEAGKEAVVPNYVRIKYLEEMTDKIIINKSDKAVIKENESMLAKIGRKMDLHTEQFNFEKRILKTMMGKRDQIIKILDRGLYKEYGVERTGTQTIDRREQRETFDPGVMLDARQEAPPPPPPAVATPPQETQTEVPVDAPVVTEEPDEDTLIDDKEALSDN